MNALPSNGSEWLRAGLFTARIYVIAGACLIRIFRDFSNDAQVAVLISYSAATLLLFVGGVIQLFTTDRPKASLNLVTGVLAVIVLALLLPVLTSR